LTILKLQFLYFIALFFDTARGSVQS